MDHPFMVKDRSLLRTSIVTLIAAVFVTACVDASDPVAPANLAPTANQAEGRGFAQRLYAIGTSISAGTCSDGNVASCQQNSWVAQLIRALHREPTLPLIAAPGCKAPLAAPLASFVRTSGESLTLSEAVVQCSPNEAGVTLPTQVLAIPGSWTHEALHQTPAARTDPFGARLYRRILPLDKSQVTALETVNPKFVTVELGANDVLQVLSGALIPGATYTPFATWSPVYDEILDRVGALTKQALLVGLASDISKLPGFRRGHEFWADRAAFLGFNIVVSANCDANHNLIAVPYVVPAAVATAHFYHQNNLGPYTLSCAAGAATAIDRILNASEEAQANAVFVQIGNHIREEAEARGYAFMDLEPLFTTPKPAFSVVTLMTSTTAPYGVNFSFDGIHPSAAGQTLLAQAALTAINDRYNLGFDAQSRIWRRP